MSNKKYDRNTIEDTFKAILLAENTSKGHPHLLDVDKAYIARLRGAFDKNTCMCPPLPMDFSQLGEVVINIGQAIDLVTPALKVNELMPETGTCICINEPIGDNGMEGYNLKQEYKYEKKISYGEINDSNPKPRIYFKVWLDEESYNAIGKTIFKRYFEIKP